jgi:phage tail protein X
MNKRIAVALIAGTAVATLGFASASALTVDAATIQYGTASVTGDTDGVVVNWMLETDTNMVDGARITGFDPAVQGADVFVKVNGGTTYSQPITGDQVKVSFPAMESQTIETVQVWIEG